MKEVGARLKRGERRVTTGHGVAVALLCIFCALVSGVGGTVLGAADRAARLRDIQQEIRRLEREVQELRRRESGLLGELERLGGELRLRTAELAELDLRSEAVGEAIEERSIRIEDLEENQDQRRRYLAFRLREVYKEGADRALRRFLAGESVDSYWSGIRYAAYLSQRDGRVLRAYRVDARRLLDEREELLARQTEMNRLAKELEGTRAGLVRARERRSALLRGIRDDAARREAALAELRGAADALEGLVDSLPTGEVERTLDVFKFRGLLDWPADGEVSAGFGTMVHPRFKTRVPHPGLDIEGDFSTTIRAIFDGVVVFAAWMRGYGLTVIVDHGGGVLSVSAHASVLLVEAGNRVVRGQSLGRVGETGSLRGPFLYFELRVDGKPVDPGDWLRSRGR
jgi:septal ring factor EnvC (AmiA/AmiB activator)